MKDERRKYEQHIKNIFFSRRAMDDGRMVSKIYIVFSEYIAYYMVVVIVMKKYFSYTFIIVCVNVMTKNIKYKI